MVLYESLWDKKQNRDYPGVLEGMINQTYDNKREIRDSIKQILEDSNVEGKVKVIFDESD